MSKLTTYRRVQRKVRPVAPETFSTTYSAPATTHEVGSGKEYTNLQTAINAAATAGGNWTLILTAGETFTGNFTLPTGNSNWVYIISSALASLPAEGIRVALTDATNMPHIVQSTSQPYGVMTNAAATKYRFVGCDLQSPGASATNFYYRIFQGGYNETSEGNLPSYIWLDRCIVRCTDDAKWCEYGLMMDGRYMALIDSYVCNIKETSRDGGYAIKIFNGSGPYKIVNNFLEASGSNFFTGGETGTIATVTPSDFEFKRNYLTKRLGWSASWRCKNIMEFKNSKRMLIEGNYLYNCYWDDTGGQYATGIYIANANPYDPSAPPGGRVYQTSDIIIRYNIIRLVATGFRFKPEDTLGCDPLTRVTVEHNIFDDVKEVSGSNPGLARNTDKAGGHPATHISFKHNLWRWKSDATPYFGWYFEQDDAQVMADYFTWQDNIMDCISGISANAHSGSLEGILTFNDLVTNMTVSNNVMYRIDDTHDNDTYYPSPYFMRANAESDVGFTDAANKNYLLTTESTYKGAGTGGSDPGPNIAALNAATAHCIDGDWT